MSFLTFDIPQGDVPYDIETYPNCFTLNAVHDDTGDRYRFEISERMYDLQLLVDWMDHLRERGCRMVGFNNIGFDYPVLHFIYMNAAGGLITAPDIYKKAMSIIRAPDHARFANMVWESDWVVPQIDLFKIHHFDNKSRSTSLKVLEFNMRMDDIEDLPFDVGTTLNCEQIRELHRYNDHDVDATRQFLAESKDQIRFREELSAKYNRNFLNHNDTKIGKDYFIMKLEEHTPGCCYQYVDGKRKMVQTRRDQIHLNDIILPIVQFEQPEFNRILSWFREQVITETKGVFSDISCTIHGFTFDFGTGGIHGSVESQVVRSDDQYIVEDWDVASYYPNLAIANRLYPAHLGETFCTIYKDVYEQRKQYAKKTAENAMLKLALNGVYGDSNSLYSPFFDPQYTMSITINGQLLLCMLAEKLMQASELQMIQINTDGLTVRYPRYLKDWVHQVARWWEQLTQLTLEDVEYSAMYIRDVNNYIGEYTDGSLKRKGAYAHVTPLEDPKNFDLEWHKNHSALVVPKAAEAALVRGADIREFIMSHADVYDFMLRTKVPRSSYLEWGFQRVPNIVRYYVSTDGDILEKVMPAAGPDGQFKKANGVSQAVYDAHHAANGNVWSPDVHTKNQSVYEERRTGVHTGWTVQICNRMQGQTFSDINYEFYITEAEKLVKPLVS